MFGFPCGDAVSAGLETQSAAGCCCNPRAHRGRLGCGSRLDVGGQIRGERDGAFLTLSHVVMVAQAVGQSGQLRQPAGRWWGVCLRRRGADHHAVRTPNSANAGSAVINSHPEISASAARRRSNGSRCAAGCAPARSATRSEIGTETALSSASMSSQVASSDAAPGSFPMRSLVEISHADPAETRSSFFSFVMSRRAVRLRRVGVAIVPA